MSQQTVEIVLGRLLCDEGFRDQFRSDPVATVKVIGLPLTDEELSSLGHLNFAAFGRLGSALDDRIRRASREG